MGTIEVRPATPQDHDDVAALHRREWGGAYVVVHDTRYDLRTLPTLVAVDGAGGFAGALVHRLADGGLEVVSLARFHQRRGLRLVAVDAGAVDRARQVKPTIPSAGADDVPLHDELVLERRRTGTNR
ncbi:hypothetical protein U2F26_10410 [Micromonospora sp. 4G57]|uniref:GNAT family N-acetyltransferase n=1 Tax=Micromonospora sicca TaxID=2202420 RepID=A0ABU5J827_9ACTN|nr:MULTISPECIES: hypothetical protein [unclassified Micromonospora]MDZ5443141.1 hypothetical protein [Micromonospora sp. 4G57]MDZ5488742.1 hypothetical protein [Micromonospora sp. 4G53]